MGAIEATIWPSELGEIRTIRSDDQPAPARYVRAASDLSIQIRIEDIAQARRLANAIDGAIEELLARAGKVADRQLLARHGPAMRDRWYFAVAWAVNARLCAGDHASWPREHGHVDLSALIDQVIDQTVVLDEPDAGDVAEAAGHPDAQPVDDTDDVWVVVNRDGESLGGSADRSWADRVVHTLNRDENATGRPYRVVEQSEVAAR